MQFLSSSRLKIVFFALVVVTICTTLGGVGHATFAHGSLLSGTQSSYPQLSASYTGSVHNIPYNITSNFALSSITEDQQGNISGQMIVDPPLYGSGPFIGTVSVNNTINFTVTSTPGNPCGCTSVIFTGTVKPQNTLSGNYTANSQTGPQTGTWQVSGTSTPTPTPVNPTLDEYLEASNAAYGLDQGTFTSPVGLNEIDSTVIPTDAYAAVALEDSNHNIIIANEGADLASPSGGATPYQNNSFIAYGEILKGITPKALTDAVAFAQKIQQDIKQLSSANGQIYVTGHDLGGVEAQAQARALSTGIAGGATFGASGLPGNSTIGGSLINYVDYGDTVGYWTSDPAGPLQPLAPANTNHYGNVREVGNPYSAALVFFGANIDKELKAVNDVFNPINYLVNTFGSKLPIIKKSARLVTWISKLQQLNKYATTGLQVAEYSSLGTGTLLYHGLSHYAADFNVSLKPTVTPAITLEEYVKLYYPNATATELKDVKATMVNANGTLTSPLLDASFDKQTGEITNETDIAANHTTYDATFDPTEKVSSILVDENTGGSYRLYNDDLNTHPWSSYANFYDGTNGTGLLIETLYNWHSGGSQVQLFTHLPHGFTAEIRNYSGPDGTGKLLSVHWI